MHSVSLWVAQLLAGTFLSILFLQSGLDKVFDWKGNKEYIGGYFSKTPLRRFTTFLLFQITVLEVLAGVISAGGVVTLLFTRTPLVSFIGAVLAGLNVVALFFGQRIAKDYAAAAGMVPYGLFTIGSVLLMGWGL
ncbi:MAG: DoxX family protein [Archangium sp.]